MPEQEEIEQHLQLLRSYRRTLLGQLQRLAKIGGLTYAPPEVVNSIIEARENIDLIKKNLRHWGVDVEDLPSDKDSQVSLVISPIREIPSKDSFHVLRQLREDRAIDLSDMADFFGFGRGSNGIIMMEGWEDGSHQPAERYREIFIRYLAGYLGLWDDRDLFNDVWSVLQKKWYWKRVTDTQWRKVSDDIKHRISTVASAKKHSMGRYTQDDNIEPNPYLFMKQLRRAFFAGTKNSKTASEVALEIGVDFGTFLGWLQGKGDVSRKHLTAFCNALKINQSSRSILYRLAGYMEPGLNTNGLEYISDTLLEGLNRNLDIQTNTDPWCDFTTTVTSDLEAIDDAALLAHNELTFNLLPIDVLPLSASFNPRSRIPFSHNPLFVGRVDELKEIAKALNDSQTTTHSPIVIVSGLGGVGKTQLAIEFAHRYGQYFAGGVFWLNFSDPQAILSEIAACDELDEHVHGVNNPSQLLDYHVQRVTRGWQESIPRLLIFDNCEDEQLLAHWRPSSGGCRILVTSRRMTWNQLLGVELISLNVLPRNDSITLLRTFRPDLTQDAELDTIAAEVGDLPLALQLAGSYISQYSSIITPDSYVAQLRRTDILKHPSMRNNDLSLSTQHIQHIGKTVSMSYEKIRSVIFEAIFNDRFDFFFDEDLTEYNRDEEITNFLARVLLSAISHLSPGNLISRDLLISTVKHPDHRFALIIATMIYYPYILPNDFDDENKLEIVSLIEEIERILCLHSSDDFVYSYKKARTELNDLISEEYVSAIKRLGSERIFREVFYRKIKSLVSVFAKMLMQTEQVVTDEIINLFLSRVDVDIDEQLLICVEDAIRRLLDLGLIERVIGNASFRIHRLVAVFVRQKSDIRYGSQLAYLATIHTAAQLFSETNSADWLNLRPHVQYLIESTRELASEELFFLCSFFADHLSQIGDTDNAKSTSELALRVAEKTYKTDDQIIGNALNYYAKMLYVQGNIVSARSYWERALNIIERGEKRDNSYHVIILTNLVEMAQVQGDEAGIQSFGAQALHVYNVIYNQGNEYSHTLLFNIGSLHYQLGHTEDAIKYYRQSLDVARQKMGERHQDTIDIMHRLGHFFDKIGNKVDTLQYLDNSFKAAVEELGMEHPTSIRYRNCLDRFVSAS